MSNNAYSRVNKSLKAIIAVESGETRFPISMNIASPGGNASDLFMTFDASDIVLGIGEEIVVYLQQMLDAQGNDQQWIDVGPVACVDLTEGDGTYGIILSSAVAIEAESMPVGSNVRLAVSTGPTSSVKFSNITWHDKVL